MSYDIAEHLRVSAELLEHDESFATVTLLAIRGSAPQIAGAKAIVTDQGIVAGTVGGGKIENAAIEYAKKTLAEFDGPTAVVETWNLQTQIGMTCGGEVTLFFEFHRRVAWPIAVFGAGHVAQALIPLLLTLNCQVTCTDSRNDWIGKLHDNPRLDKRCVPEPKSVLPELAGNTFFVLMSKGHATDLPVLAEILRSRRAPYLGVIGSAQKASVLRRDLKHLGIDADRIDSFHCPIGLPLGNNTPSEIAISVAAQLIQVRDQLGVFDHRSKSFQSRGRLPVEVLPFEPQAVTK
jgi:xanthine dehydrogenase accessory factor